ncbi:NUDIX hydrolase domain-like protein [Favolaschia claudopus]|uniref:NUDIX hydrolase domain-like protein n=1 Tax=Favolaschia claudopus TaxID=2862362 RepID=A0AAW0C1Y9_9AGAR
MSIGYPTQLYFSEQFVISAGCVLFRKNDQGALEIGVLRDRNKDEWMLPKGRKDCGESIETAAVRETFEETGYPCTLLPIRMATRAPQPGNGGPDAVAVVENITEPIAVAIRDLSVVGSGIKVVWWFMARVMPGEERVLGTQTEWEAFDTEWVAADNAVSRLTFASDKDTVERALKIIREGNNADAV